MPQYTSNMDLYKVDLETDGNSTFNIKTMLNDNWDKIDSKYDEQDGRIRGNSEVVNEVKEDIGDKSELKTEDKSSLVGAVNEVSAGMADIAYKQATVNGREIQLTVPSFTFTNNKYISVEIIADIPEGNAITLKINAETALNLKDEDDNNLTSLDKGFYTFIARTGTPNFFLLAPKGADIQSIYGAYDGSNVITVAEKVKKGQYIYSNHDTWLDDGKATGNIQITPNKMYYSVVTDDYVFYQNNSDGNKLYRVNKDGTNNIKLTDNGVWYLSTNGQYIFYSNKSDSDKMYRINLDGTNNIKILDIPSTYIYITDNYIFYRNGSTNTIYRANVDGSNNTSIGNVDGRYIQVKGNYVFYTQNGSPFYLRRMDIDGSNNIALTSQTTYYFTINDNYVIHPSSISGIYKMDYDGNNKVKISDERLSSSAFSASNKYLYFRNSSKSDYLYRINLDGSDLKLLNNVDAQYIVVDNETIFYANATDNVGYKYVEPTIIPSIENGKGQTSTKVNNDYSANLQLYKDYIYYRNSSDSNKMYKIKYDGTERQLIINATGQYIILENDFIYYSDSSNNFNLYRANLDGTNIRNLYTDRCFYPVPNNNIVYFMNGSDSNRIYRVNNDGTGQTKVSDDVPSQIWFIHNNEIYYTLDSGHYLYKINIDGTGRTQLNSDNTYYPVMDVANNVIYYRNTSDSHKMYKVDYDGNNRQKVLDNGASFLSIYNERIYYMNINHSNLIYSVKLDGTDNKKVTDDGSDDNILFRNNVIYYANSNDKDNLYSYDLIPPDLDAQFQALSTGTLKSYGTDRQQITGFISKKPIGWSKVDFDTVPIVKIIKGTTTAGSLSRTFTQADNTTLSSSYISIDMSTIPFTPQKIVFDEKSINRTQTMLWKIDNVYDTGSFNATFFQVQFGLSSSYGKIWKIPYDNTIMYFPCGANITWDYTIYGGEE